MKIIRRIASLIKPYIGKTILSVLFSVLGALFAVASIALIAPFLGILFGTQEPVTTQMEWAFDTNVLVHNLKFFISQQIEINGSHAALLLVGIIMGISTFLKTLFQYASNYTQAPIRTGVVRDVRNKLYNKIITLHASYFSEERKGDIISRMTTDIVEIENSIVFSLNNAIKAPITFIIMMIMLVKISPQMTLFILVLLPVSGLLIGKIGKSLRRKSDRVQSMLGLLLSYIEETLFGMRIIKSFNAEKKVETRFYNKNNDFRRLQKRIWRRRDLAGPLSEFLATITIISAMWYGGKLVLGESSSLSAEALITFLALFSQVITPAKDMSTMYYNVQRGMASLDRVDKILDAEVMIKDSKDAKSVNEFNESIEYKNVSFKYIQDYVLKNINLKIEKGKTIALVGQSGSGKSTMADLVPRFYDIEEGEILIDGTSTKEFKLHDLRNLLGIVSQESVLFNDTIFNNIAFGKDNATMEEVEKAARIANAHEFILQTENGYETNIGDRGTKLSGGQRQRLSIARAVLKNPPIMILDEATSSLDTESEKLVQDALYKLMENRTSIVIAHRLSTIHNADEICVMNEGEIVERGKHDELLNLNGAYKKLHDLQSFS